MKKKTIKISFMGDEEVLPEIYLDFSSIKSLEKFLRDNETQFLYDIDYVFWLNGKKIEEDDNLSDLLKGEEVIHCYPKKLHNPEVLSRFDAFDAFGIKSSEIFEGLHFQKILDMVRKEQKQKDSQDKVGIDYIRKIKFLDYDHLLCSLLSVVTRPYPKWFWGRINANEFFVSNSQRTIFLKTTTVFGEGVAKATFDLIREQAVDYQDQRYFIGIGTNMAEWYYVCYAPNTEPNLSAKNFLVSNFDIGDGILQPRNFGDVIQIIRNSLDTEIDMEIMEVFVYIISFLLFKHLENYGTFKK